MMKIGNVYKTVLLGILLCIAPVMAEAASLALSPSTGVYPTGALYTVKVSVNTSGKSINAAEGTITFNPKEVAVVSVDRGSSIFNLWVAEPTFSNTAGTISFSGGLPSGYTGSSGNVFSITFKSVGSGPAKVSFSGGAVLANDGQGTNVLSAMNGGTYTIQAVSDQPVAEEIEYIAPANTPGVPKISSKTHADPMSWYTAKEAVLTWSVPADVTTVRTALDRNATTIPTKIYETPISTITIPDVSEGINYFHLQFKNADGWGKVAHYRLAVDTKAPSDVKIALLPESDLSSPIQKITVTTNLEEEVAPIVTYKVKIDDAEPKVYEGASVKDGVLELPSLAPGYHTVLVEVIDQAGNSSIGSLSFTIESFSKPVFTEYPNQINEEVIPVIKGTTRPGATVFIELTKIGSEPVKYEVVADQTGTFLFIPASTLTTGVYDLTAVATDQYGAQSELSNTVRIVVQAPGYMRIGQQIVSFLSVVVTLLALLLALVAITWVLFMYTRRLRKRVYLESSEVHSIVLREFSQLEQTMIKSIADLAASKRTKKLSEVEDTILRGVVSELAIAKSRIEKEVVDVESLVKK